MPLAILASVTAPSAIWFVVTALVRILRPEIALSAIFEVVTVPLATFDVVMALATMSPFWMLLVSASFEYAIAAVGLTSALAIDPSAIVPEFTVLAASVGFG